MTGENHDVGQLLTNEGGLRNKNLVVALATAGVPSVVHLYPGVTVAIEVINQLSGTNRE